MYNGTSFSSFGLGGLAQGSDNVNSIVEYNNELYIGGSFSTASGSIGNNIMRWDGILMKPLLGGMNGSVSRMRVYPDGLYVCGAFNMADTVIASGIAKWNGSNWERVIPNTTNLLISDFLIRGNELYITGSFSEINSIIVNNIAKYILGTGINDSQINNQLSVYPNPSANKLNIEINSGIIQKTSIYNLTGKLIKSIPCNTPKQELDISTLSPGLYFLDVVSDQRTFRKRFVKN